MAHTPPPSLIRLLAWLAFAACWLFLLTLTHLPPRDLPRVHVNDKIAHLIAYGSWAALLAVALWLRWPVYRHAHWLALPAGMLAGALDEWTQPWAGRTCDIHDWLADLAGLLIAIAAVSALRVIGARKRRAAGADGE